MLKNYFFKTAFVFAGFLMLAACGKKQEEDTSIPPGIMSQETFTRVLTDFALAESAATMNVKNSDLQKLDSIYAFNPLRDNGVTQGGFDSATAFYVRHPQLYKKVYEDVLVALSEMQAKRNPMVKDSSSK